MTGFKRATKAQAKLRLALAGPAGAGKTFTALTLATHLAQGGPVGVIDTERGSASKYADRFTFDVLELQTFDPESYIAAIRDAEKAGIVVLVIDSLSHAWMGKGGVLEIVDNAAKRSQSQNSYVAWRDVTPRHNALVDAMLGCDIHLIVTLRSKQDYVQEKDDRGKMVVRKVGMAPIQRDGVEYEFDVYGDLDQENTLVIGKTRCSALARGIFPKPGADVAKTLLAWLTDGVEAPPATPAPTNGHASREFAQSPEGRSVIDPIRKLRDRYATLATEANALNITVHPIPQDATEDQITDLGLDLKNRIDVAKVPAGTRSR